MPSRLSWKASPAMTASMAAVPPRRCRFLMWSARRPKGWWRLPHYLDRDDHEKSDQHQRGYPYNSAIGLSEYLRLGASLGVEFIATVLRSVRMR